MQYQCWICPECHDDHPYKSPCTPKNEGIFMPYENDNSHIAKEYRKRCEELNMAMNALRRIQQHERRMQVLVGLRPIWSSCKNNLRGHCRACSEGVKVFVCGPQRDHICDNEGPAIYGGDGVPLVTDHKMAGKGYTWGSVTCSKCGITGMELSLWRDDV